MLRSRFEAVPAAFSRRLMPSESKDTKRKDMVLSTLINHIMFEESSLAFEISTEFGLKKTFVFCIK
jgi:hypothetical protein